MNIYIVWHIRYHLSERHLPIGYSTALYKIVCHICISNFVQLRRCSSRAPLQSIAMPLIEPISAILNAKITKERHCNAKKVEGVKKQVLKKLKWCIAPSSSHAVMECIAAYTHMSGYSVCQLVCGRIVCPKKMKWCSQW